MIYTYTPDMTRPSCPDCGSFINDTSDNPELEWSATCSQGHRHTYQLDTEEEAESLGFIT